jgi:hypothetical protein
LAATHRGETLPHYSLLCGKFDGPVAYGTARRKADPNGIETRIHQIDAIGAAGN